MRPIRRDSAPRVTPYNSSVTTPELPRHLYVHVPFCGRRCTYCDFAIAVRRRVPIADYVEGIASEMALRWDGQPRRTLETLYLGGGTPSKLGGDGIARLLNVIRERADMSSNAEVTLEANPEDVNAEAVRTWRAAGVNRLSLGAQSFDSRALSWMHRTHNASQIDDAVEIARAEGISNLSVDLIFALPREIERSWSDDVAHLLSLEPSHVSLYGLTVEPATPLGRRVARGEIGPSTDERYEEDFLHAHAALDSAGYEHYEVSNFARPGAKARHNSAYWSGVPYAGIGPSAHAFDGRTRSWNVSAYEDWLARVRGGRIPVADSERLTSSNQLAERVYLGLRTNAGVALQESELERIGPWVEAGWATLDEARQLTLTSTGWLRLDALAADLTLLRSR